jgi:hypothetical protein
MEDTAKLGDRNVVYSSRGQEGELGLGKEFDFRVRVCHLCQTAMCRCPAGAGTVNRAGWEGGQHGGHMDLGAGWWEVTVIAGS